MAENSRVKPVARPGLAPGPENVGGQKMALTIKRIAKLRQQPGKYLDEHGLILRVFSPNSASWFLRYQQRGRERWLGLGPLHAFTLLEVRERARRARALLADGVDPLEQKRAAAARSVPFAVCAEQCYAAHLASWSNAKYARQYMTTLRTYAFPRLGGLPVTEIDEAMVLATLKPIWHTKTVTARRLRHRIEKVFDFAIAARYRSGDNPARWSVLKHLLAAPEKIARQQHLAALPYAELPAFMVRLRVMDSVAARALEFCILTAARSAEVYAARWDEIDWKTQTWTVPAARMKARKEHRVPLSAQALTLLKELYTEDDNDFVFVGARPGGCISDLAMIRVMRQLEGRATVHGFRSTFSDWAHETSAFPNHVIEQSLAHAVGSAVERAYHRGDLFDKRKQLMEAWAQYCSTTAVPIGEVVPLRSVS
jgi:integrase